MTRILPIDIFRTTAIVSMVIWHSVAWFSKKYQGTDIYIYNVIFFIGSYLSPPYFYFISGVTIYYKFTQKMLLGIETNKIYRYFVSRGIKLIIFGYLYTFLIVGVDKIFHAWVLQSIGLSLIICCFLAIKPRILLLVSLLFVLLSILIRSLLDYQSVLIPGFFLSPVAIYDMVKAIVLLGAFPLIPWASFMLLGVYCGAVEFGKKNKQDPYSIITIATFVIILGLLFHYSQFTFNNPFISLKLTKYPISLAYFFVTSGISVIFFHLVYRYFKNSTGSNYIDSLIINVSKNSLQIFCVHYFIGTWLSKIFPNFKVDIYWSIIIGFSFLILFIYVKHQIQKNIK